MTPTEQAIAALIAAKEALSFWVRTYAPDMCEEAGVAEARKALGECGTLWYIANANKTVCDAIARLQEGVDA